MPARNVRSARGTIYLAQTEGKLRLVTLACWAPVAICAWLVTVTPREAWARAALGDVAWWILPAILLVLALLLPVALIPWHGRRVMRVVLERDGQLRVTTFRMWGPRTEKLQPQEIAARRFRLDRAGEAPLGFEALVVLGFVQLD
jgi:hypothetical protein